MLHELQLKISLASIRLILLASQIKRCLNGAKTKAAYYVRGPKTGDSESMNSMKKMAVSSIVALAIASGLQADMDKKEYCKRVEKDSFAFAFPKDMNLVNPSDVYFYVTGLYIQASEGGLEWGVQNKNAAVTPVKGKVLNFDWNYNPGVRVGFGGYIDHDAWNLEANWTWVHFSNYENVKSSGNISPSWLSGSNSSVFSIGPNANAGWNGQYNVVDTWMGKPYHVSRHFLLNPVIGVRLAFIDQDYDVHYGGLSDTTPIYVSITNNFWGLGLRAGMNSEWVIAKQWRFFGMFAGSIMRGHFAVDQHYGFPTLVTQPLLAGGSLSEHFWDTVPVLEAALGLQWGMHFNCDRNYVAVRFAYEFYEWFDQFQARKYYAFDATVAGNTASGNEALRTNFTLNGFSLAVQFDF